MKAVCVLLFLALAVFGVRAQDAAAEVAVAEPLSAMEEAPAVDAASEVEEAQDEAVEESEAEEESEDESEEEDEFSLIEAEAEAEADESADAPKKAVKIVGRRKARAPLAIKKVQPFKFHSERIEAQTSKYEDPEMAKLNLALAAVKEDILSTNKQITDERKWVIAVAKIIASYNDKMKRVEAHIIALRKEMKSLYRKKKQIENLKLQRALEAKLKEARDELATLSSSLKHVSVKQGELNKSGADLRNTIAGIQAQLAKLRGQKLRKPKAAVKGAKKAKKAAKKAQKAQKCGKGKRFSRKAKKCVAKKPKAAKKF